MYTKHPKNQAKNPKNRAKDTLPPLGLPLLNALPTSGILNFPCASIPLPGGLHQLFINVRCSLAQILREPACAGSLTERRSEMVRQV